MSDIEEAAKATQEVAKTTSKGIDAISGVGKFISGPVKESLGILEDKLKYMRWERRIRLIQRANKFLEEQGFGTPNKPLPIKHAVPLLEYASLEEDDELQDLWAQLLVNGTNTSSGIEMERSFIEVLAQLSSLEVKILKEIYSIPFNETKNKHVVTENLPSSAWLLEDDAEGNKAIDPSESVKMALANLVRLGCLRFVGTWGGGELYSLMNTTLFGHMFVLSCTRKFSEI